MRSQDLIIIDLKKDYGSYRQYWYRCLSYIESNCGSDQLYKNYLNIDLDYFINFIAIIYNDSIISFGGIEYNPNKWGDKIARVLTRFWIHPDYRTASLTKWDDRSIRFSPMVLKPQLEFLSTRNDIFAAMITREGKYKRSFQEIVRLANTVSKNEFSIQEGLFNVCYPDKEDDSCRQMIALSSLKCLSIDQILTDAKEKRFLKPYYEILR
jgi:hypothetical protein